MAKDFAFLFYVNDWAGGTQWLTRLQRGGYLDLLLHQVNNTSFSLDDAKKILGSDFDLIWPSIKEKFLGDENNLYSRKMREVLEARSNFTQSRRENRLGKTKNKKANPEKREPQTTSVSISEREQKFKESLYPFVGEHPKERVKSFFDYWSEKTTGGLKMRFELQKTWEVKKRLTTWVKNEKPGFGEKEKVKPISKMESTLNAANNLIDNINKSKQDATGNTDALN